MSMPPIELKDYTVKEISLKVNEEYDPREHKESPNDEGFQFMHFAHKIKKREWMVMLGVKLEQPEGDAASQVPYFYKLELVGFFDVHPKFPRAKDYGKGKLPPKESDEIIKRRIEMNGPAMLYGIAREKIRSLSAASSFPEILIPTVTFERKPESKEGKAPSGKSNQAKRPPRKKK